jgi:hypothetical protein
MGRVGRSPSCARFRAVLCVSGALWVAACTGTEHIVFRAIDPGVASPDMRDVGPRPSEPPIDAGAPAEDAGPPRDDAGVIDDPQLDPDVTFDWRESLPGQGTCKAGGYAGAFVCIIPPPHAGGLAPPPVAGQLSFRLGELNEDQLLPVTEGSMIGLFFNAAVQGSLRCEDYQFDAQGIDGAIFPWGGFEAELHGTFDPQVLVIAGEFVRMTDSGERCEGEFHVSASP